jgi:hypothetical protein
MTIFKLKAVEDLNLNKPARRERDPRVTGTLSLKATRQLKENFDCETPIRSV